MTRDAAAPGAAAAVSGALRFERDAASFYRAAAGKAVDPFARQLFEMFAEIADRRAGEILALAASLESSGRFPSASSAPFEDRARLFRAEHDRIASGGPVTADGATVIREALARRAEGREMYTRLSVKAVHPLEKEFFRRLAEEETRNLDVVFGYLDGVEAQLGE